MPQRTPVRQLVLTPRPISVGNHDFTPVGYPDLGESGEHYEVFLLKLSGRQGMVYFVCVCVCVCFNVYVLIPISIISAMFAIF
jgi:hypothetical protein